MHVDHVYVGTVADHRPVTEPEHHVRWFTPSGLAVAPAVSDGSRHLAAYLLNLAAEQPGPHFNWPPRQHPNTKGEPRPGPPADATVSSRTRRNPRDKPQLIIIRGNSASGKSTIAATIRARHETRDLAIVSQDTLRRDVLSERDVPDGANIELLDQTARFALARGFHLILEGILSTRHYTAMLTRLIADHPSQAHAYYLDIPFGEP